MEIDACETALTSPLPYSLTGYAVEKKGEAAGPSTGEPSQDAKSAAGKEKAAEPATGSSEPTGEPLPVALASDW